MNIIDDWYQILFILYDKGLENEWEARPNKRMKKELAFRANKAHKMKIKTTSWTCLMQGYFHYAQIHVNMTW